LQVWLHALTLSHPYPVAMIRAFQPEHEQTIALLLAQDVPDEVLDIYRTTLFATLFAISPNTDIAPLPGQRCPLIVERGVDPARIIASIARRNIMASIFPMSPLAELGCLTKIRIARAGCRA
jgi:hypothetical protein